MTGRRYFLAVVNAVVAEFLCLGAADFKRFLLRLLLIFGAQSSLIFAICCCGGHGFSEVAAAVVVYSWRLIVANF